MSGLTGTNYPLCMYVCQSVWVFDRPGRDTYDNTAVSYSPESGSDYIGTEWLPFYYCFLHISSNIWLCLLISCPMRSSARERGMEKWSERWRARTDVTVSRCRSSQTLTHFHSAHHKRPLSLSVWVPCRLAVGAWRYRGVGFHCLLLTCVRPQPRVCVHLCWRGFLRGGIHMCGFARRRSETSVAPATAPSSLFQP